MKPINKIKTSLLQRSLAVTKMGLKTGTAVVGFGIGSVFKNSEEKDKSWQKLLAKEALNLAENLGQLKGSLMKAGQMLSMYGELFLPEEANFFLKKLQAQSPPLEFLEIFKLLKAELGVEIASQLEIDSTPIGSASLGQVHKGRLSGRDIAIKIQYPGVAEAIDSDLKAIRSMLSMMKLIPNNVQTEVLFKEVRNMLHQEVDYAQELKLMVEYIKNLGEDKKYVIPRPVLELCSAKVLTSTFEEGLSPDDPKIQNLSQERRNSLARNFLELYFQELFSLQLMQTDPHLGNYKVRLDEMDQWVLLDFGAVKAYSDSFIAGYRKLVRSALDKDREKLLLAAIELRYVEMTDPEELKNQFVDFCIMAVEPFSGDEYDWKKSNLAQRLSQMAFQVAKNYPVRSPPGESIFLDRKTGGVFVMMSVLGAKISARDLIEKYL